MSQLTTKTFRNNAPSPVVISVFARSNSEGTITEICASGGTLGFTEAQRAESARMHAWVRRKFMGQAHFFFNAHSGIVPAPVPGTINIINPIGAPDLSSPESARRIAENIRAAFAASLRRPLYQHPCRARFTGMLPELGRGYGENVSDKRFFDAPTLGTYWRQKARNKDYQVVSVSEHDNYVTVRMRRTENDGLFDFPFHSKELWLLEFEQLFHARGKFYTDPYAMLAEELKDVPYSAQRVSLEALRPERRYFVIPPNVGKTDVDAVMSRYRSTYPDFARRPPARVETTPGAPWIDPRKEDEANKINEKMGFGTILGRELPPAEGERYQSLIMGRNIYRVLDARRKLHSEDWYITMIRECDGHKCKFTYRNHAAWFLVWVPVLDEEVQQQPSRMNRPGVSNAVDAADAIKRMGEAAHEAAQATWQFREADAERQLRIIMAELDKRLPNWNDAPPGPVMYDDCSLIVRAIRTLARAPKEAEAQLADSRIHAGQQLEQINRLNKKLAKTRIVPAIGSVWRTNSTDTYATVTHVFAESGMAKMRSAKGAEYDLPLDRLFEYSTLATGPATLLHAIGEVQCDAYGLTRQEAQLKDIIAGSVFRVHELQHSSTGDVTVSGFLHAKKPAEEG